MAEEITAKELLMKVDSGEDVIIVDVRSKSEYDSNHIEGAILIPLNQLTMISSENIPKESEFYVICRSGARSAFAVNQLHRMGYKKAINVSDGMLGWNEL